MKRIILKSALVMLMLLTLSTVFIACNSYDDDYAIYELWVGGIKVTTRNQNDILGDGTVSYEGDKKSGVLTFNNINLDKEFDIGSETGVIMSNIDDLTINLVGENKIGMGEKTPVNSIVGKKVTFTGNGSLEVGGRASCITAENVTFESGNIDTYIKTTDEDAMSFLGVGVWVQELLEIKSGTINVHFSTSMMAYSYGLYCTTDILISGGTVNISEENAPYLAVGLIASEKITVNAGAVNAYGLDDAINAKFFEMTGGTVDALALDFSTDGVCRLVYGAKFTGGEMTLSYVERLAPDSITLVSRDLSLEGVSVYGGDSRDGLSKKDESYTYTDAYIRIAKEEN